MSNRPKSIISLLKYYDFWSIQHFIFEVDLFWFHFGLVCKFKFFNTYLYRFKIEKCWGISHLLAIIIKFSVWKSLILLWKLFNWSVCVHFKCFHSESTKLSSTIHIHIHIHIHVQCSMFIIERKVFRIRIYESEVRTTAKSLDNWSGRIRLKDMIWMHVVTCQFKKKFMYSNETFTRSPFQIWISPKSFFFLIMKTAWCPSGHQFTK